MLTSVGMVVLCVFGCGTRIGADELADAKLVVEVVPVSALVLLDENAVLRTRVSEKQSLSVDPGFHRVEVEATGFRPYRTDVELRGGEIMELNVELWPLVPEID